MREDTLTAHKRRILFFFLVVLLSLCMTSVSYAYSVRVEIVPLGDYPETALPPGEAFSDARFERHPENGPFDPGSYMVTLDATANPDWLFLGWEFDERFYWKHTTPDVQQQLENDIPHWVAEFEIFDDFTAKAVYSYIGAGSVYDQWRKNNPVIVQSGNESVTYNVGVYERGPVSVDGEYGTLFCDPYEFSNDMNVPAGSMILLAALPRDGFEFDCWRVFQESKKGFDQPTSNVLIFTVEGPYSIDAIFKPAK